MILAETRLTAGATMFFIKNIVKVLEIFWLDSFFDQMIRRDSCKYIWGTLGADTFDSFKVPHQKNMQKIRKASS